MWLLPDIFGQCHHYLSPGRWRMNAKQAVYDVIRAAIAIRALDGGDA